MVTSFTNVMFLQLVGAFVVLGTTLYFYFTRNYNYWKDRNVPGPKPVPLFGNIMDSAMRKDCLGLVTKKIYDQYPNEKVVGMYRMTSPCLLIRDLDLVKQVLIKDFDSFVDRGFDFGDKGLGVNLFHANSEKWRVLRNRFTPVFTSGKLKNMMYLITERADHLIEHLKSETMNKPKEVQIVSLVQMYTISSIAACAFGLEIDTTTQEQLKQLQEIDKLIFKPNLFQELDMMYPSLLKKIGMNVFPNALNSFFRKMVTDIINQRNGMPTNRRDFMDLILELRNQKTIIGTRKDKDDNLPVLEITDEIISAQAFVFFAAGYETSATTMGYMFYELAMNPDVQEKLIAEITEVLQQHNGEITYEVIQSMTYLAQVFDETLRKYPIVDPLIRCATHDYKLPGTDVVIKKGQPVLIPVTGIQMDEKHYPNPQKFDPDRFTVENSANRHSAAYLPFGIGPRNCIGMRFAQVQSRICAVKLLSHFRLEVSVNTPKRIEFDPYRVVISAKGGIALKLVPRN